MPWWGWHACQLAPRNWCLAEHHSVLVRFFSFSFLSLKVLANLWQVTQIYSNWICIDFYVITYIYIYIRTRNYCGLGICRSSFLTHCSPIFFAQAGTSRDHTISLENGCGTITVRPAWWTINTFTHTHIIVCNYIYIYIYIFVYLFAYSFIELFIYTVTIY